MPIYHVDDLRVAKRVYVPEDSSSIIDDPLLKSTMSILVTNTIISYVVISDIINKLTEFNTHVHTEIHICKESTSNVQDALVKASALHMMLRVRF